MARFSSHAISTSLGTLLFSSAACINAASAEERRWPQIGMGGAVVAALLEGQCPTTWQPAPYVTCVKGQHVITATSSAKDRIYYIQRIEPTDMDRSAYAAEVAVELGFEGDGVPCDRYNNQAICWTKPDGTQLFAAMNFDTGKLATQLINEAIKKEDGPP
jgi:hypothetical protein